MCSQACLEFVSISSYITKFLWCNSISFVLTVLRGQGGDQLESTRQAGSLLLQCRIHALCSYPVPFPGTIAKWLVKEYRRTLLCKRPPRLQSMCGPRRRAALYTANRLQQAGYCLFSAICWACPGFAYLASSVSTGIAETSSLFIKTIFFLENAIFPRFRKFILHERSRDESFFCT